MKKYSLLICINACLLLTATLTNGQSIVKPDDRYTRYDAYYSDLGKYFLPWKASEYKTINEIQTASALLNDDKSPARQVETLKGNVKVLTDEAIFSNRKNSVFVVGRLYASSPQSAKGLNFDLTGTAFAIAADGICVTNYHVLEDLIRPNGLASKDSLYFIETAGKKVYLIDSVLAFSKNNDLAVFKVNTNGDKLVPIPFGKPAAIGSPAFCLSHPLGHFYYFSKGVVARNVAIDSLEVTEGYDKNGMPPIRMEITADYGVGSSGGPILDQFGNLIGVVISTFPIIGTAGKDSSYIQMMVKDTSPVKALSDLLGK